MKKILFATLSLIAVSLCVVPLNVIAFEQKEANSTEITNTLEGLSPSKARGGSIPTANWNVSSQGRYNLSGTYSGKYYLYSNYNIFGKNKYNYYFHNESHSTLEIRLRHSVSHAVLKTHFVSVGGTISDSLNMTDKNSRFYFEFYGISDYVFSGYVQWFTCYVVLFK